jgi:hypothetical protein
MTYGSVAADQIQNTTGYTLGAGNATNFKNRIINGAMVIDQRTSGGSTAVTSANSGYLSCDRWVVYNSPSTTKFTIQQNAGSVTPPVGFSNYLGATSTSAYSLASSDYFNIQQKIEGFNFADLGWGTANAKTITISFWVYSSLTGTFGGLLTNANFNRSYAYTYSIPVANTWTQISVTIAGDTTGTWVGATNSIGVVCIWNLGCGSTYSTAAGSWTAGNYLAPTGATSVVGTNNATFYITGVQLEVGSYATGFEYRDYGRELILCQRYFNSSYDIGTAPADSAVGNLNGCCNAYASSAVYCNNIFYPVTMRTSPIITFYKPNAIGTTNGQWAYYGSSGWVSATGTATAISNSKQFNVTFGGSFTTNGAYLFAGGYAASAEL